MKFIKILVDVVEGIRSAQEAAELAKQLGVPCPKLKFVEGQVIRVSDESADKFISRSLGEAINQTEAMLAESQARAEMKAQVLAERKAAQTAALEDAE